MKTAKIALAAVLMGGAGLYTLTGFAANTDSKVTVTPNWLPMVKIIEKVEAAGFTNIESIERDNGQYEVKATNKEGVRTKLYLDRESGEILKQREKSQNKDCDFPRHDRHDKRHGKPGSEPAPDAKE